MVPTCSWLSCRSDARPDPGAVIDRVTRRDDNISLAKAIENFRLSAADQPDFDGLAARVVVVDLQYPRIAASVPTLTLGSRF